MQLTPRSMGSLLPEPQSSWLPGTRGFEAYWPSFCLSLLSYFGLANLFSEIKLNADERSPSAAVMAFAVGNIQSDGRMHPNSGYGRSIAAFAPGTDIKSAGLNEGETVVMTGTSQSELIEIASINVETV